ncbi:MAG: hypothetical protein ACYC4N_24800 [Pirellulaceae bacterium]
MLVEESGLSQNEPMSGTPSGGAATRVAAGPVKSYTEAVLAGHQPRVVDLIPTRPWTISVLILLAISMATGLEALYGQLALGYSVLTLAQVPAVDLDAPGSVADWFLSGLLLVAAGLGMLTSLIRRHRIDDYRGRYRVWYWVVPLLLAASLNQVADLSTSLRTALLVLAGIPDYPDAPLIWVVAWTVAAAAVGVRLAIEMRACRLAVVSLAMALASYAAVGATQQNWVLAGPSTLRVMAVAGFRLAATISLFLALCLYSRYVFRDASGEVASKPRRAAPKARPRRKRDESAVKPAKPVEPAAAASSRPSGAKIRIDAPHTTTTSADAAVPKVKPAEPKAADAPPATAKRRMSAPAVVAKAVVDSSDDELSDEADQDDDADGEKLSKAERRRLRKLQRRDRQQS